MSTSIIKTNDLRTMFELWFSNSKNFKDFEKLHFLEVVWDKEKNKYTLSSNGACIGPAKMKQEMWLSYKEGYSQRT